MQFEFLARADRRVAISATLVGAGVGLALGAGYMASGMAQAVADHGRAGRIAQAASSGFSESVLQQDTSAMAPGALGLARQHDPLVTPASLHLRGPVGPHVADDRYTPAVAVNSGARDLDCLTQAVYFEARGETPRGQAAIAQVVLNRVKSPAFPKTVCGVVYQGAASHGCQFSFACDGSMGRVREASAWSRARKIAARALSGAVLAEVGSATHFHTTGVSPDWGPRMLRVAQVGLHVFYRFGAPRAYEPAQTPEQAVFASLTPPQGGAAPMQFRLASALATKASDAALAATSPNPAAAPIAAAAPAPVEPRAVPRPAAEPAAPALATKTSDVASKTPSTGPSIS